MTHRVALLRRQHLADGTVEIAFERPHGIQLRAGQKITFSQQGLTREYTPVNAPDGHELQLLVRHVPGGRFSSLLVEAPPGTHFDVTDPFGYFTLLPSNRHAVWVATGTGIAPFVAYARSGATDFTLLHGVRSESHLYYCDVLKASARAYVPCLSSDSCGRAGSIPVYNGRVTAYLAHELAEGVYDFYLCGRAEMIKDAMTIIDQRFPESTSFSETYF